MTPLADDPARFAEDVLAGFCDLYPEYVRQVPGGVVSAAGDRDKVAVVVGGGSGHYPAFCGIVEPGLAAGAVVGNVFTSPSAADVLSVTRACAGSAGALLLTGNYAGDVMNFSLARQSLVAAGIPTTFLVVTDDIASAGPGERHLRRGIAGDLLVFKVAGAAAEEGLDREEVVEIARRANDATRTLGVAFDGCTMPGASEPLFDVPSGCFGLGVGIHGEPGLGEIAALSASDLAALLVDRIVAERPPGAGRRVAALLNGLGRTKYEELFLLWRAVRRELAARDLDVVAPEVGEFVTSLDMAGCSLTLMWLDDDLERLWTAPVDTPAFRRGAPAARTTQALAVPDPPDVPACETAREHRTVAGSPSPLAERVVSALDAVQRRLATLEPDLARLDAVAGDGDHGRGMVRGATFALAAARAACEAGHDGPSTLRAAGEAWADKAGGTSGVLWGAGLVRAAGELGDDPAARDVLRSVEAWIDAVEGLGKATLGDKTMLDVAIPFRAALAAAVTSGDGMARAWAGAAEVAAAAAEATSDLVPRVGRARPLADRSRGVPDPGAVSCAAVLAVVGASLTEAVR